MASSIWLNGIKYSSFTLAPHFSLFLFADVLENLESSIAAASTPRALTPPLTPSGLHTPPLTTPAPIKYSPLRHVRRMLSAILAFPAGSLHISRSPCCFFLAVSVCVCSALLFVCVCVCGVCVSWCPNSSLLSIELCLRLWNAGHWSVRAS